MREPDTIEAQAEAAGPVPALRLSGPVPCPRCRAALSRTPPGARFCSRCGLDLLVGPSDDSAVDESHSLMLMGYANAMYNLGCRYEMGRGTARNADEAIRCYFKAAKLGNPYALARLAPHLHEAISNDVEANDPPLEPAMQATP